VSEVYEQWMVWREDGRGWYLVNDPETTFNSEEEAEAYCDEHNRARAGQAVIEERAAIVAWLRSQGGHHADIYEEAADDIEAGKHLKEQHNNG
jgi:hypothetical protein